MGWAGNLFLVFGFLLVGKRYRPAFILTVIGEVLWTAEGVRLEAWDIISCGVVFGVIAVWNWYQWGRQ